MSRIILPPGVRVPMRLPHYKKPMNARAEDARMEGGPDEAPGTVHIGVRWHMDRESYERMMAKLACYNCLTTFPAVPCKANLGVWKQSGFNHPRPPAVAYRLIREEKCPVCTAPINDAVLALHDEGENPLNARGADE